MVSWNDDIRGRNKFRTSSFDELAPGFGRSPFWINHNRTRVTRVLYDFNTRQPYESWHIYDESGTVDLIFTPEGERNDKMNGGPLVKMIFRQFVGVFDGFFKPESHEKLEFKKIKGFCEIHKAVW